MSTSPVNPCQDISWNRVSFQISANWQPVVILENYLLFEDQYQPVLELKWQHIRGSFSVERILKQLRRSGSRRDSITPQPVPRQWQQVLEPFNCYCFSWKGKNNCGLGLLRHCPRCNLTLLLQFYTENAQNDVASLHFLQTLECHRKSGDHNWAIYDIQFSLPETTVLQSQEFLTGRYRINFSLGNLLFSLLRFKPAKVLLAEGGLMEFGNKLLSHGEQYLPQDEDLNVARWHKQGNSWLRFKARLRKRQADHFLQLRYIPAENVILGVQAESNQPIDKKTIQVLLDNYQAR